MPTEKENAVVTEAMKGALVEQLKELTQEGIIYDRLLKDCNDDMVDIAYE